MGDVLAALRGLAANLMAGARIALFLPVARTRFRLDAAQLLLAAIVSAIVDAAADFVRQPPGALLDWSALGGELASLALLVTIAALAAWLLRDAPLLVALPIVVLVALPLVQVANLGPGLAAASFEDVPWVAEAAYWLMLAWFLAVLVRSAFVALQPDSRRRVPRALGIGALLALPLFMPPGLLPENPWWAAAEEAGDLVASSPASEAVLALQRELQDDALGNLADHAQGETQLYFVGFAPDGDGATWRARLEKARSVMDVHWDTDGRSLVYVNDLSTLTEAPMATVTFLREALDEIAAASNPDEDILMLYVAGRSNADGSLRVSLPPLGLVQLSGAGLAHLLRTAGIKWRVIVVASCNPQPFVDALADANTLLIATAGSPSCANGGEPVELGDALFGDALAGASSLTAAFQDAHRRLAAQNVAPTIRMGDAIGAQLARLRSVPGGRASLARTPAG